MRRGERNRENSVAVVVCGVRRSSRRRRRLPELVQATEEGGPAVVVDGGDGGGCKFLEREMGEFKFCFGNMEERERSKNIYIFLIKSENNLIGCMGGNQWMLRLVHKLPCKCMEP